MLIGSVLTGGSSFQQSTLLSTQLSNTRNDLSIKYEDENFFFSSSYFCDQTLRDDDGDIEEESWSDRLITLPDGIFRSCSTKADSSFSSPSSSASSSQRPPFCFRSLVDAGDIDCNITSRSFANVACLPEAVVVVVVAAAAAVSDNNDEVVAVASSEALSPMSSSSLDCADVVFKVDLWWGGAARAAITSIGPLFCNNMSAKALTSSLF